MLLPQRRALGDAQGASLLQGLDRRVTDSLFLIMDFVASHCWPM